MFEVKVFPLDWNNNKWFHTIQLMAIQLMVCWMILIGRMFFIVLAGRETECQPVKVSLYYCIFYFTLWGIVFISTPGDKWLPVYLSVFHKYVNTLATTLLKHSSNHTFKTISLKPWNNVYTVIIWVEFNSKQNWTI